MDNKGFISIEYLFALFLMLIIALGMLFLTSASLSTSFNIEDSATHRMILDNVADQISQVNSNGKGYSKIITLPGDEGYYEITIDRNKATIEYDDKKGETTLPLTNIESKTRLISGKTYMITRTDEGVVIN